MVGELYGAGRKTSPRESTELQVAVHSRNFHDFNHPHFIMNIVIQKMKRFYLYLKGGS